MPNEENLLKASSNPRKRRASSRKRSKQTQYQPSLRSDSSNWSLKEVDALLEAIRNHGHLNYEEIMKALPNKTVTEYKNFLRRCRDFAQERGTSNHETIINYLAWVKICENVFIENRLCQNQGLESAIVFKMLSLDGVLENHPLREDAGGIDFGACYRLIYQAMLQHPIQSVNKETAETLYEILSELNSEAFHVDVVTKIKNEVKKYVKSFDVPDSDVQTVYHAVVKKRPHQVYQKKKALIIEPTGSSGSPSSSIDTSELKSAKPNKGSEEQILMDIGFNPLQLTPALLYDSTLLVDVGNKRKQKRILKID